MLEVDAVDWTIFGEMCRDRAARLSDAELLMLGSSTLHELVDSEEHAVRVQVLQQVVRLELSRRARALADRLLKP